MPFFLPAIAAMLGGGAAAGAGAGAAAGGGLASMGAGGSMLAGAGAGGVASSAGAAGTAGDGLWAKLGNFMKGDEETGENPMKSLADFGDAMDQRNYAQVQQIPHPVPGGAPNTNPGLFGLQDLVGQSNRGGWGRF